MDWTTEIRARFSGTETVPDDVVLELAQHAEAAYETARADGLSKEDAAARVSQLLDLWCREPRDLRHGPAATAIIEPPHADVRGWSGFWQDVRYGIRLLRRQPGFGLVAMALVAIGVAAVTTLFSITYAVLLKPLPWPAADRIVRLAETREGATREFANTLTNGTYLAWQDAPSTIESIASWNTSTMTARLPGGEPERLTLLTTTASLFGVLNVGPEFGALFTERDEPAGSNHVVVLSFGLWQRRFGGSPDVIGSIIDFNGDPYVILGVMPRDFYFPDRGVVAWAPSQVAPVLNGANPNSRRVGIAPAIARLRAGVTPAQASAEATARGSGAPDLGMTGMAMFGTTGKPRVTATPYLQAITADVRPALYILVVAVVLLLVAAVANIAGMQLARATTRRHEVAIRAALGATSGRLARQLLAENLVIGAIGGLIGLLMSAGLHRVLPGFLPDDFPRAADVQLDWRVASLAMGSALAASAIFAAVPALLARRLRLVDALVEDSLAPVGGHLRTRLGRMRGTIMASQVAIAALLLVIASLLGRSFVAMLNADRGYDPSHLLTALAPMGPLKMSGIQRVQTLDTIVDRLEHTAGVTAAGGTTVMPLWPNEYLMSFQIRPGPGGGEPRSGNAAQRQVSPGYFSAMGMRVIAGRTFTDADTLTSEPVVVVNRQFAHLYFADRAVGEAVPVVLKKEKGAADWARIVGVVENVRQQNASDAPQPELFINYRQLSAGIDITAPIIVVRTSGDPGALVAGLRQMARDEHPLLALSSVMTMDQRLRTSLAEPRMYSVLLAAFAVAALVLCGVGLFGVLSYSVAQRTRELGIRAVLGARPAQIAALVARQGLAIAGAGAVAGLVAAFLLATLVSKLLFGVDPHDPASFAGVFVVLVVVAAIACYLPARRAAGIDPIRAIRR